MTTKELITILDNFGWLEEVTPSNSPYACIYRKGNRCITINRSDVVDFSEISYSPNPLFKAFSLSCNVEDLFEKEPYYIVAIFEHSNLMIEL